MADPAFLPLVMLSVVAPIGAIDVVWFHLYTFRLFERPASAAETATHLVRALLLAVAVFLLTNYRPDGAWFWVVAALLVLDFVNNVVDVALEPASRLDLGGIPPVEAVVHVVGATGTGAIAATWLVLASSSASLPTALTANELPSWLVLNGNVVALGGLVFALVEGALCLRTRLRR